MDDDCLAEYQVAEVSDDEWNHRLAVLRQTRQHAQTSKREARRRDLHARLADLDERAQRPKLSSGVPPGPNPSECSRTGIVALSPGADAQVR